MRTRPGVADTGYMRTRPGVGDAGCNQRGTGILPVEMNGEQNPLRIFSATDRISVPLFSIPAVAGASYNVLRAVTLAWVVASAVLAEDSFVPLFNSKDLSGWVNVNCAPNTFSVREGMIVSTGIPTGIMHSEKQYENFELELEWRHMKAGGNAGLFVWSDPITSPGVPFARSIEVQIIDGRSGQNATSHGDVFAIHGASFKPDRPHPGGWMRCLPSEHRAKPAGEWNHYRVVCRDGDIKLAVNGKVVSGGSESKPRKGYLCLESEGSECHFRNIRIKELPSTNPLPDEIARPDEGFKSLYTGIDLSGWKNEPGHQGHWQPEDWILEYDGKSEAQDKNLWSEKEYGDFVLICDWRWTAKGARQMRPVILPTGEYATDEDGNQKEVEVLDAGDSGIYLRGSSKSQINIWCWPAGSGEVYGYRLDKSVPPEVRAGVTPKVKADKPIGQWNRFEITMKGDRLTVHLNGQKVIENARLPDVPKRGPIALQHHGDPIQFANIFVKEL
ncbi:MAG: 3-keto-disaccharide hydrolase [Verrucomicrobiales bacterium]